MLVAVMARVTIACIAHCRRRRTARATRGLFGLRRLLLLLLELRASVALVVLLVCVQKEHRSHGGTEFRGEQKRKRMRAAIEARGL